MAIIVKDLVFTLHTRNSTYQMKVDEQKTLLHTYYGAKADETDFSYLVEFLDRGFCGNVPGTEAERIYSLDYLLQEYSTVGSGDYRASALRAELGSGTCDCRLIFDSYEIREEKYSLPGLPSMFDSAHEKAQTLEIVLKDAKEAFYARLLYGVFEEHDLITRSVKIENRMDHQAVVSKVMSLGVDFPQNDFDFIHFHGKHMGERQLERCSMIHGGLEIRSTRGASSHQQNPFVILAGKETTESQGPCYGFSLLYSGGFHVQAEVDPFDQTRLVMGIDDEDFRWILKPGGSFTAPEAIMCFSEDGFEALSHCLHDAVTEHIIRGPWKKQRRPILVNSWEAAYFDFNKEKLLTLGKEATELGLDMLVLDDGWFGKRDTDTSGLGDWFVNEKKIGGTLGQLSEEIHAMGLSFGLWIEPEMVSEDSDLYRTHPEWAIAVPGREPIRGRQQLVLDMTRDDVIDYLYQRLVSILDSARIEYVKWDMNRSLAAGYSRLLPKERQGEFRHRFVLGVYQLLEKLVSRYPDLLIEGCCGGGGRYDMGMMHYCPQIWCSDNTDAVERLRLQYGTSFAYPMSSISAHVSACPNHQNGRVTPFKTRGICAMQGTFGYELDLGKLDEAEKKQAREQIEFYKKHFALFQYGRYYRLNSPFENQDYTAWEYVDPEKKEAIVSAVFTDLHANPKIDILRLRGLDPGREYRVWLDGEEQGIYTGTALMRAGIRLPIPKENYDAYQFYLKEEVSQWRK
ncbi:MAG: alpha-galactosidase [Firmicutes bacterium]|jgi:alpha-galactosidase|nr:alpha-galactosidase [Bacillota bacterium]